MNEPKKDNKQTGPEGSWALNPSVFEAKMAGKAPIGQQVFQ